MRIQNHRKRAGGNASRRRGVVVLYLALGLVAFLGVTALVIDLGYRYYKRQDAQKAADAAALAGAFRLWDGEASVLAWSNYYAALNGYDGRVRGTGVTTTIAPDGDPSHCRVTLSKIEPLFFGSLLNPHMRDVGATATAEARMSQVPINITGGGQYGAKGPLNISVFGPDGYYDHGDAYSVTNLTNGNPNPLYNPDGYDFAITVPSGYQAQFGTSQVMVEIFDPDCYNVGNDPHPNGTDRADEWWAPNGTTGNSSNITTTRYALYWDNGTVNDLSDDVLLGSRSYGSDSSSDMRWVSPSGFTFDRAQYPTGKFRLNVKSTSGSSENGFNLRAGPPHNLTASSTPGWNSSTGWAHTPSEDAWYNAYGKYSAIPTITGTGKLPMNFNVSGTVTVTMGYIAAQAASGQLFIDKFDTDVGAKSIVYSCDTLSQTWPGTLAANGTWARDTIPLPDNYAGGIWTATYQAGVQDTSIWSITSSKAIPGQPGGIRLIR
jgi:Putative Flp pilus-assembly TadE/G-like